MKKRPNFSGYPLMLISLFVVFASSCKKEDGNNNETPATATITDARDGNVYKTITIGNQVWLAENLRYLPAVAGPETGSNTDPYYYVYDYSGTDVAAAKATTNYGTYGVLYNWPAAMAGAASSTTNPSGVQGACPAGWHIPSYAEWIQLWNYLGGKSIAGGKLKEAGTDHWTSPNTGATNESGFTALPGGDRRSDGIFDNIGYSGFFWSSTESPNNPWYHDVYYTSNHASIYDIRYKEFGVSIRCIKD
jgi:uncharacterized protein (TIGR02145 family)